MNPKNNHWFGGPSLFLVHGPPRVLYACPSIHQCSTPTSKVVPKVVNIIIIIIIEKSERKRIGGFCRFTLLKFVMTKKTDKHKYCFLLDNAKEYNFDIVLLFVWMDDWFLNVTPLNYKHFGSEMLLMVERPLIVWWGVRSILHGGPRAIYRSHQCSTIGVTKVVWYVDYYPVGGMVHLKAPLLIIRKSSPWSGDSGFSLSPSERSFTIFRRHITVNKTCWVRR